MIVVTVEQWPSGLESEKKELGRLKIKNTEPGNYDAIIDGDTVIEDVVVGHDTNDGVWRLVVKALHMLLNRRGIL